MSLTHSRNNGKLLRLYLHCAGTLIKMKYTDYIAGPMQSNRSANDKAKHLLFMVYLDTGPIVE